MALSNNEVIIKVKQWQIMQKKIYVLQSIV